MFRKDCLRISATHRQQRYSAWWLCVCRGDTTGYRLQAPRSAQTAAKACAQNVRERNAAPRSSGDQRPRQDSMYNSTTPKQPASSGLVTSKRQMVTRHFGTMLGGSARTHVRTHACIGCARGGAGRVGRPSYRSCSLTRLGCPSPALQTPQNLYSSPSHNYCTSLSHCQPLSGRSQKRVSVQLQTCPAACINGSMSKMSISDSRTIILTIPNRTRTAFFHNVHLHSDCQSDVHIHRHLSYEKHCLKKKR